MGTLNKYFNAAAVEEALDKGVAAHGQAEQNKTDIASLRESIGGTQNEESYELIDKCTLNDSDISMIMRTKEPDETPYDFKKVLIKVIVPTGKGKAEGQININTDYVALWREDLISAEKQTASVVKAVIENGYVDILPLCSYNIDERTAPSYRPDLLFIKMANIKAISVFVSESPFGFPRGTSVEIYAVRN